MSSFYTRKGVVSLQIRLYFVWPFFVSYLLIRNFMEVNEPVLLSLSAFSFFFFSFFVLSHSPLGAADVPLSGKDAKLPLFKTSFPAKRRAKTVLFNV